jgi:hypothetical protein
MLMICSQVVEMSHQKQLPAETKVLGQLELVPRIRAWTAVDEIQSIEVERSEAWARHAADPPK